MSALKVIRTASGTVTLRAYVAAWRKVLASPDGATWSSGLTNSFCPISRKDLLGEFSFGVHDRINRHLPWFNHGRKWSDNWQTETARASRMLNQPRLVIDWLPAWLVGRFQARLRNRF